MTSQIIYQIIFTFQLILTFDQLVRIDLHCLDDTINIFLVSLLNSKTDRFHVAVHLFSN